jgi:hypothetical protein
MYGDYEAQRHWMEITVNLPPERWFVAAIRGVRALNATMNDCRASGTGTTCSTGDSTTRR